MIRKPIATQRVVQGIIAATSNILAGLEEGECKEDWDDIQKADEWARQTRTWMKQKGVWK